MHSKTMTDLTQIPYDELRRRHARVATALNDLRDRPNAETLYRRLDRRETEYRHEKIRRAAAGTNL